MAKSVINLLPPELLNTQKSQRTLAILIWSAGSILLLTISITAAILLYKLFQIQIINSRKQNITDLTSQINSLQIPKSLLFNIHNRLNQLNQVSSQNSLPLTQYTLTLGLVPPEFKISSFINDSQNSVKLSVESTGSAKLKNFFNNLTSPQSAEGKISKVELDSLSRNATDKYKIDLTITYK